MGFSCGRVTVSVGKPKTRLAVLEQAPCQACCSGDMGTATVLYGLFPCLHFPSVLGDAAKDPCQEESCCSSASRDVPGGCCTMMEKLFPRKSVFPKGTQGQNSDLCTCLRCSPVRFQNLLKCFGPLFHPVFTIL